jgi:4-hydroxybenzoate polyprenyltransferase
VELAPELLQMNAINPVPPRSTAKRPLAVDLDGTLIRCDIFIEGLLKFCFTQPWRIPSMLSWFARGRAYAKRRIFEHVSFDPATLPYDERVLDWIREERAAGRTIALATASDRRAADAVAKHLGLFDAVFASDGEVNLKSVRKAEALCAAYPDGFVYAGNERADLKVWRACSEIVTVNASPGLARRAGRDFQVERRFAAPGGNVRAFLKAIRPQQWSKNLLVFLPMLVGQAWMQPQAWTAAFIAFFALSFTASSVYLVNDAADIDADRAHPRKRKRPFASGAFPPVVGLAAAMLLLGAGLALSAVAGVLPLTLCYLAATLAYTFWLKRIVLIDVFLLAGLYAIRVILGGAATGYYASDWLLAFSCFFFLSLALVKRVAETRDLALRGGGAVNRRGYFSGDTDILSVMGVASGFVAALVLALYLQDDAVTARFSEPFLLWALPAVCVFWVCRVWIKAQRGEMHDDPILFAVRDRTSWFAFGFAALCFLGAVTLPENMLAPYLPPPAPGSAP